VTLLEPRRIDFQAVREVLRAGRATEAWLSGWLPSTWNDPARFQKGLYGSVAEQRGGAVKGRPGTGFDFYHDCVLANVGKKRAALVVHDDRDLLSLSFDSLHERSSALANAWRAAGIKAGESVAIVLPVGIELAVAMVTALRMGLTISVLPPLGPTYVRSRVSRLGVDHVVSSGRHERTLAPDSPLLPLAPGSSDASLSASHTYADDDIPLRLLSAFGPNDADPSELSAAALHEALVRDSALVYTLAPGERLAAPGFDPLQMQPLAMLTAWIAGAAWVELEPRHLEADAKVLIKAGVTTLGVSRALRELLLRQGAESVPPGASWFRAMNDVLDYDRWQQLSTALAGRNIFGFALLTSAASGGAHLFAPRGLATSGLRVWPVPGRVYQLSQVGAGTLASLGESGTYTPLVGEEPDASLLEVVLTRDGHGWTLGGSLALGPEGRSVPGAEIARAAERHPAVRAAAVVVVPGRWMNDALVVLLVFVEADARGAKAAPAPPTAEILARVRQEMGDRHVPARVAVYALRPRFIDGVVDVAWCRSQYLSGALSARARSPIFAMTARLGWIFGDSQRTT
jgi:hypothetical protein